MRRPHILAMGIALLVTGSACVAFVNRGEPRPRFRFLEKGTALPSYCEFIPGFGDAQVFPYDFPIPVADAARAAEKELTAAGWEGGANLTSGSLESGATFHRRVGGRIEIGCAIEK